MIVKISHKQHESKKAELGIRSQILHRHLNKNPNEKDAEERNKQTASMKMSK